MVRPEGIAGSFVPAVDPSVVAAELDGELVLYHEGANTVHVLNTTATAIWHCLDGRVDVDGVCNELAATFSLPVDHLSGDVLDAVKEFGRQGLLCGVEPDPEVVAASSVVDMGENEPPRD